MIQMAKNYDKNRYTKLSYASSGQQESIWILLLIFLLILDRKNVFIVFEEPEAHLYPEAQKNIVDLISLLWNSGKNQVILTTHSPYILSSLNNLISTRNISEKQSEIVSKVVNRNLWLRWKSLDAYFVNKTEIANIIDPELKLIQSEAIDSASAIINDSYNKLFEIDN